MYARHALYNTLLLSKKKTTFGMYVFEEGASTKKKKGVYRPHPPPVFTLRRGGA